MGTINFRSDNEKTSETDYMLNNPLQVTTKIQYIESKLWLSDTQWICWSWFKFHENQQPEQRSQQKSNAEQTHGSQAKNVKEVQSQS